MNKIHLILVLLFAFALLMSASGVASAISITPKYVGNTMVDLSWTQYESTDFSKYELCRDGVPITTITDRTTTFYRDTELTKGNTYDYEIRVYSATGVLKATRTTSATTGEVHGTITIDTTWTAASSPYTLTGSVNVRNGATLTIGSGVVIVSEPYLKAISVEEKGVLYADGASFYEGHIEVHDYASIKNCFFEHAGINLHNLNNSIIAGNTVNRSGIKLYSSSNNVITDNTVSNNILYGIELLYSSSNNSITNNTVSNNDGHGIELLYSSSNNVITDNIISNNDGHGIYLYSSSNNNAITDNIISNNDGGIYLYSSSNNNTVTDNTVSNNSWYGIYLYSSSNNNAITDNIISNNDGDGIELYYSSNNSITNNTVSNNSLYGICLSKSSNNNTVTDNTVSNNSLYGIKLYSSSNNVITDNTVSNNSLYGISLSKSSNNNTVTDNTVSNNSWTGIYLYSSSNNTLYNNYFNNTHNAYDNGNNTWNITKTAGTNIVGGPYLGGNYWSDYKGRDVDGDELGDTLLPYCAGLIKDGGDYHPLIEMPIEIEKIITLIASPEELPANGMNKSLITAIVADQTGPVVGVKVSFSLDNTSLGKLEPLTAKTNESGIATSNFTVGTIPGVVNVTANESKTHASDSVKIILGMIKINHTSSTYQFIPTPCRNATINFEIKPALLRDSPETNVSMIIRDKNSKLVYNSSEDQNAQINKTTAIWTGKNTTGVHVDPRLSNYTVEIIVKYRNMTVNDTYNNVTVLPNKVIVVVDEERMRTLYNDANVNKLMANLTDYCCRNNGTLYNLTKVRHDFNADPGLRPAFTYRQLNQWLHYPKFVERRLENVTKFMIQNNNVSLLLVGNDRVIPFHRKTPPKANLEDDYTFVPGNVMWTDYPYSDLNHPQDWRPDVALGRLIGDPDLMRNTLANAITQYRSNTALIASCNLGLAETQNVGNKFNTTWGFKSQNVFKYYEISAGQPGGSTDDIANLSVNNLSFLQRLDDGHTIIYTVNHGNDFRELGKPMHNFSDHTPFKPYKTFLNASNIGNLNGHPFYATIACHGGVTYPDDTVNTNMPLAFLNGSAVGYLGSTAYTPYAGLDFFPLLFDNMRVKNPTGESIKLAKRSMMDANYDTLHGVVDWAMHLYGDPLYTVYVPSDPEEPSGYNISIEDDIIKVTIITYDITTVETAKGDRNLIVILGADLVSHPMEYVVPEIVVKMSLSPEYDINKLNMAAHDKTTIANIELPLTNPGAIHFIDYGYLGDKMDLPGLYPDKFAEFDIFEDPNGDKNVVFRIFPFQYNENTNEIYLYKNITLSYTTKPAEPKPPVRLSVTNDFESEITAVASTVVGMFIDNYGTGNAKNVNITEKIPDGFNVTFVSNGGTFNTATNIITWEIQSIGYEDFKMLNYELVAPQTVGNYTINTTIEYTDENGTVYPVINISKSIIVSDVAQPDLTLTRDDIRVIFNENATVSATIHNIGTADASNIVVQFFDGDPDAGGTQIGTDQTISGIAHESTGTVQETWTAIPGTHDIFVRVDPYDSIQEANENNNQAYKQITVGGKKTIYVDDDFTDDPANHKWDTIQEGINDATDGDTVLVYNGTYTENVVLNKTLTLIGEGTPTIDAHGSGDAFAITADVCTVKGFTCVNAYPFSYAGIRVESNHNVIEENMCENNDEGIYLLDSSNEIRNNAASSNNKYGIRVQASDGNIISNNTVKENGITGISVSSSNNNEVRNNVADSNPNYGIKLWNSTDNIISNNTVKENGFDGISLQESNNNEVRNNVADSNHYDGIELWNSTDNIISNNTVKENGFYGISVVFSNNNEVRNNVADSNDYNGIVLWKSTDNIISNNTVKNNEDDGIYLQDSNDNRIADNDVSNNVNRGISVSFSNNNEVRNNVADSNDYDGIELWKSTDNTIANNTVKNNEDDGISLTNSNNNRIYMNNFLDNQNNVYSEDSTNIWHSPSERTYRFKGNTHTNYLGNYWDDYTGSDTDNDGIGDMSYNINSDSDNYPLKEPVENYFALQGTY